MGLMIEALTETKPLNHDFQDAIEEIIEGVEKGDYDPLTAFRHAWRAAFAKQAESDERIAGLDTLLNCFPKEVQENLNRPLNPEGENALMIIAEQETAKAQEEGRLPKSVRKGFRLKTARMRGKLNL